MSNIKNRISFFTVFLMFVLLLAGCWDTNEPERMIYVHGLGIDYEDGKYNLYLQIVNPTLLAKSESTGGQTDTKVIVGHGTGETINEAIFDVYKSSQRRIFWGHLSYFVFTENVLKKEGLKAAIDLFDRYRETRYNTWVYTTKEPLFPLLTVLPPLEMSTALSQLSDPYPKYRQNSIIRPVSLRELLILLNEPPHIATIPYVGLTKKHTWETDKKSIKTIELIGATFISEDTFKKSFLIEEIEGIKWMNEDLTREELKLKNELSHVSLLIDNIKIEKKPIIKNNKIHFQISIKVLAKLREIVKRENLNKIEKETEKLLKSQIQETFRKGLEHELDVFRLSEVLYRQDVNAWKAVEQNGKIPLTKDSLQLSINVKLINGEKQRKMPTLE